MTINWFVVWSARGSEFAAADALHSEGFDVFVPKETYARTIARKQHKCDRPLFPRYLFAGFEDQGHQPANDDLRSRMGETRGVERVLGRLSEPAKDRLYRLKIEQARGDFDTTIDRTPKLAIGDLVQVEIEGRAITAEITDLSDEERVALLLINFLGRNVPANVARAEVRAA